MKKHSIEWLISTPNNIYRMKKNAILLLLVFVGACKSSTNDESFNIDITAVYKNNINSYKIESNGKVLALFNKSYEYGKVYETKFTKQEMDSIQVELRRITSIKCDTLKEHISDGFRYAITLDNQKQKINLGGNLCAKYESLDKLVYSIVKKVEKRDKKEFYNTFNHMVPPQDITDSIEVNNR